jgi:YD repeat-containing protein
LKKCRTFIVNILVATLLLQYIPATSFAQKDNPNEVEPPVVEQKEPEKNIIGEVKRKREKNVKHFLREDQTYEAVVYPAPIHYKENGKWKDIDNTLVETVNKNDQAVLTNKQNRFNVHLAKNARANQLVKIKKDHYEISWNIENPEKTFAVVRPKDLQFLDSLSKNERIKTLTEISSTVDYQNIYPHTDLSYEIFSEEVKENIIIREKIKNPVFTFNLKMKNLIPKLQDNGSIVFFDAKAPSKHVFSMDAPYMYDAEGAESRNITVNLEGNGNGYTYTIQPDSNRLTSEERVYPITIDPTLSTSLDRSKIYDNHVSQGYPTTNYYNTHILKTGYGSSSKTNRTYMSFELPELSSADLITDAYLYLSLYSDNSSNAQVNAHKVLEDWDTLTINWDNQPSFNQKSIEDYQRINGVSGDTFTWNITDIVKEWYATGNNYGLMIKNRDESSGYTEYASSDISDDYAGYRPQVSFFYVTNSGLENYWTYHSQDVGRAGTGYVNDSNGNLVYVHNDLSMNGNLMPISIHHIFNSNDKNKDDGYGLGWRTNFDQTVEEKTIDGTDYILYTDEDGSVHYFKEESTNTYKDESGLDLTLTVDSTSSEEYTITDKKDNKLTFLSSGYLRRIIDQNGNEQFVSYSGTSIDHIKDQSGRMVDFVLDDNGRLQSIEDPSGKRTSFGYENNQLKTISYPDGNVSTYSYDSTNHLNTVTNFDGYQMDYSYNNTKPYRIKAIQEKHSDGTIGKDLSLNYGYNQTTFTDYKGRKSIHQFNRYGNTVSVKDDNGYANYYTFIEDGGNKHKMLSESKLQKTTINYLLNHNAETNDNWSEGNWSDSTGDSTFSTEESYIGEQSLKVEKTNTSSRHYFSQTLSLEKGKTYTLSGYIKTKDISNVNGQGATLFATYKDSTDTWQYTDSAYIQGTNGWDRSEVTFTVPADATSDTVYIRAGIAGETGTAYFDSLQLEEGSIANRYNLLENPDFRYGSGTPTFWTKNQYSDTTDTLTTVSDNPTSLDDNVYKINGVIDKRKNLYQSVNVSGNKGDAFVFSGWAKGDSVDLHSGRRFSLEIGIKRTDGSYQWVKKDFNTDSSVWQYLSEAAVADSDYTAVYVYTEFYDNENSASFDGLQLYKEQFSTSYQYDEDGNLITTEDLAKQNAEFKYDSENDLVESIDPEGHQFQYDYDTKHNLTRAKSSLNVTYSFEYDDNGNPKKATVGNDYLFTKSNASYTTSGQYLNTLTDASGNKVTYSWDEAEDELDVVTDAKGNDISYTYDELSRITSTSKTVDGQTMTNDYTYKNDRLESVLHNGFGYTFGYDSFGNNTTVSVGDQTMTTHVYETYDKNGTIIQTGKLKETQYGNGQTLGYDYDSLDRLIGIRYGGQLWFENEYDGSGNIGFHNDLVNGTRYRYIYDLSNRLTQIKRS